MKRGGKKWEERRMEGEKNDKKKRKRKRKSRQRSPQKETLDIMGILMN